MEEFFVVYNGQKLRVAELEHGHDVLFKITWPSNMQKSLYMTEHESPVPVWKFIGEDPSPEADAIGKLIEEYDR